MYRIKEFSQLTSVSAETIRYYERAGVLPYAERAKNGYRVYSDADVERLRFISGARRLGISLREIEGILAVRDEGVAPCIHIRDLIQQQIGAVEKQIQDLKKLRGDLRHLQRMGRTLPDDVEMEDCICGLIKKSNQT